MSDPTPPPTALALFLPAGVPAEIAPHKGWTITNTGSDEIDFAARNDTAAILPGRTQDDLRRRPGRALDRSHEPRRRAPRGRSSTSQARRRERKGPGPFISCSGRWRSWWSPRWS